MIQKLIFRLLEKRHSWRTVGFSELAELYASTMLRSLGLSIIGVFVPIYLYKIGYDIPTISLFMGGLFATRIVADVISGYLVARVGPKHSILGSNLMQIVGLMFLVSLPQYHWPLWIISIIWGFAASMFFIAYHVDFSKIMHRGSGGKELGFMTIMERMGAALGPLIGGVIATLFGAEYTIMAAIVLFMGAVIPLFLSAETTRLHQKISFRGLPYRKLWRDFISFGVMGADNTISISVWPLFAAITILTVNTYASIGLVTSLGIIAAILAARFIGNVVDRSQGVALLNWSVGANAFLHLVRPFTSGFGGVIMVNIANEVLSTGYKLPFTKGMYGRADDLPGFRIAYLSVMEMIADIGKTLAWLFIWVICFFVDPITALWISFFVIAAPSALMSLQRFPAIKRL